MLRLSVLFFFAGLLASAAPTETMAGGGLWDPTGSTLLWDDPNSWEFGVPEIDQFGTGDAVFLTYRHTWSTDGPTIEVGIDAVAGEIILGWTSADNWAVNPNDPNDSGPVTLNMTGGTLTSVGNMWIGKNDVNHPDKGPGIFNISGGTVDVTNGPQGNFVVGQGSEGTVNQTGGSVSAFRLVLDWYDTTNSVPGTYNLHGGELIVTDTLAPVHLRTQGLIDITEGVLKLDGDFQGDILGFVASNQLTAFSGGGTIMFDFDVTNAGMTTVWAEFGVANADFDGSGTVTGNDFLIWQQNSGSAGTQADGDANNDSFVDGTDLGIWETQYGTSPIVAAVTAVPEPGTVALCGVCLLMVATHRRRTETRD